MLASFTGSAPFENLAHDTKTVAGVIAEAAGGHSITSLEFVRAPFFRNKEAYLVGRAHTLAGDLPLAIALLNTAARHQAWTPCSPRRTTSRIVFSFARSYFLVETACPAALVAFLRGLMPRKPMSELYASIGQNRHGKTEFYRALLAHLANTDDQFEIAPGARGMVMVVFTLPGFDVVFKVIRDRFEPPKTTTRAGRAREVPAGLSPRPRRPAGGRPGVRAPEVRPCAVRAGAAGGTGREGIRDRGDHAGHACTSRTSTPSAA